LLHNYFTLTYTLTLGNINLVWLHTLYEYAMGRANTVRDTRIGYTLWAIAKVAFCATIH